MQKRQTLYTVEVHKISDDSLLIKGTPREVGAYLGRNVNYILGIINGRYRLFDQYPDLYFIVYGADASKAPGCKYVKNFQVFALKEYGNTIIRDRHWKHRDKYIQEFKKFGLEVEIYKSVDGNIIAVRRPE